MKAVVSHSWDVTPGDAVRLQRELAPRVVRHDAFGSVRFVSGTDISTGSRLHADRPARAAVVTLRWPELEPVEQVVLEASVRFPYVPGLLSFREIPVLLPVFEQLRFQPDLVVVDGQGIAHPRRLGLAAHLGVLLDTPAIGCAKSRLVGEQQGTPAEERGATAPLIDAGECIGYAVRTRASAKPVYVSLGHRVSASSAVEWVLALAPRYRLPEPTRLAHLAAAGHRVAPNG